MTCKSASTPHPAKTNNILTSKLLILALLAWMLAACGLPATAVASQGATLPPPEEPTATSSPPVASVNDEEIPGNIFAIHLAQYQAAQTQTGTLLATQDVNQVVLDDLIDRQLLAQGARDKGFTLDEATLDQRLSAVVEQAGGQEAFDAWLTAQGYTPDIFRQELGLEIEAGWMRTQITDAMPISTEQVLAQQILLTDDFQAERLLAQLKNGAPFEQVARNNDSQGLGYLGWFPRGYLLEPAVEEAAFALQPGEYSDVVQTDLGYHLIEVIDRDADRPLSPQQRLALQNKALIDWLAQQRSQATIQILQP